MVMAEQATTMLKALVEEQFTASVARTVKL
jgi:hypothetical protein